MVEVVEMMVEDISHILSFFSLLIFLSFDISPLSFLLLFFSENSEECHKDMDEFLGFMKRLCNKCEV